GAAFSHREVAGTRYFNQHDFDGPQGAPTNLSDRHDDGKDWNADTGETLRFEQKLGRPQETLSLALQHSGDHERETNAYINTFSLPLANPTFDDIRLSHDLA